MLLVRMGVMVMSRWLRVTIAGLVLGIALGAGATVAVLAATSGGHENPSPSPAKALVGDNEERPWLGVIVSRFGDEGVIVQQVFADSPAHEAGVKRGDIIKAFEGNDVRTIADLVTALGDKAPGDQVTLTLLRDDEEMTLQVTLGERPEPLLPQLKGPLAELGEVEFADILSGQFRVKDDQGNTVTIEVVPGEVKSISDSELTLTANDGGERTFTITDETVMPQRPEEGDPAVVVTVGDSKEARLVLPPGAFQLPGVFDSLRERIREGLMPSAVPGLDIPSRLRERGFGPIPEWRFRPSPALGSDLPGEGFWLWDGNSAQY
jgi:membrane-associated protease RseP (regulator of RpoE activity)